MKKNKRTKWTYTRAQLLEQKRLNEKLTWEQLGRLENQTAGAIKASVQKWLKRAPRIIPSTTKPPAEEVSGTVASVNLKRALALESVVKSPFEKRILQSAIVYWQRELWRHNSHSSKWSNYDVITGELA